MGRRPDPSVAELKASLRTYLDEALSLPIGLVLHADAKQYVLRIAKQVKAEELRWSALYIRPGDELNEVWIIRKDAEIAPQEA